MKRIAIAALALGVSAVTCTPLASAADFPKRKAGLWEMSMQTDGASAKGAHGMTMQQCTDEKTDADLQQRSMKGQGGDTKCDPPVVNRNAGGWVADVVCHRGNGTQKSHAVGTGDFGSNYQVDITVTFDPPEHGMDKMHSIMKGRYLGACTGDMKPGDMAINGMKMNMNEMAGKMGNGQKMTPEQIRKMMESMRPSK